MTSRCIHNPAAYHVSYSYIKTINIKSYDSKFLFSLNYYSTEPCFQPCVFNDLWPVWLCCILCNYLANGIIFRGWEKCFSFNAYSYFLLCETFFHFRKNLVRFHTLPTSRSPQYKVSQKSIPHKLRRSKIWRNGQTHRQT